MALPDNTPVTSRATFSDLQIHPSVSRAITDVGYESPTEAATIPALMAGSGVLISLRPVRPSDNAGRRNGGTSDRKHAG